MIELPGLTTLQTLQLASLVGAVLFFAAGMLASSLLRRSRTPAEQARLRAALADAEAIARDHSSTSSQLRTELELHRTQLVEAQHRVRETTHELSIAQSCLRQTSKELAEAQTEQHAAARELAESQALLRGVERELQALQAQQRDTEAELAARTANLRDLASEQARLHRRLEDADALRAEYVRLRTAVTETEFLKTEVARLEEELRQVKMYALSGPTLVTPRRQPRGSTGMPAAPRSISESLAWIIERFADQHTRGSAIADTLGFPLASTGEDGHSLAAYAALAMETASRAKHFLPLAPPRSIEIVDERGARVSVWRFDVESEPLMLANLAVSEVDGRRVESTLADLAAVLAPTQLARPA